MRVLLLLPTSSYRVADFLSAAERMGVEVVVASEEQSTMEPLQRPHLITLDFRDPAEAAERVSSFHERFPIDAVVPVDEETVVVAAAVASRLGLAHHSPQAARRARLKHEMRRALEAAGVASPRYRLARTSESPEAIAKELHYPVVLKPVFLSGSRGVIRANGPDDFATAYRRVCAILASEDLTVRGGEYADLLLIEDFVPGDEVAVEALLTDGAMKTIAIFDKPDPLEGPYFEETIYVTPSRLPPDVQRAALELTARAALAMGLRHGPVHAELRVASAGTPSVIEIAGRSIGGLCSRSLRLGVGLSLEDVILKHAIGETVETIDRESNASGVMMIPIPNPGVLEAVSGVDDARSIPGVEEVTVTAHVGQRLVPLPEGSSYVGFIFARAETPERAEQALRDAHAKLTFSVIGDP